MASDAQPKRLVQLFDDAEVDALLIPPGQREFAPDEVVDILRQQIAYLLEHRRDWLLGKLYRLDVRERDIKAALAVPQSDTAEELARLIVARQAERAATKVQYGTPRGEAASDGIPDDLAW